MVASFLCVKESEQFFFFFLYYIFINNQGKQRKMVGNLNIHCYSYQVKKQFYHINGMRVLTMSA